VRTQFVTSTRQWGNRLLVLVVNFAILTKFSRQYTSADTLTDITWISLRVVCGLEKHWGCHTFWVFESLVWSATLLFGLSQNHLNCDSVVVVHVFCFCLFSPVFTLPCHIYYLACYLHSFSHVLFRHEGFRKMRRTWHFLTCLECNANVHKWRRENENVLLHQYIVETLRMKLKHGRNRLSSSFWGLKGIALSPWIKGCMCHVTQDCPCYFLMSPERLFTKQPIFIRQIQNTGHILQDCQRKTLHLYIKSMFNIRN